MTNKPMLSVDRELLEKWASGWIKAEHHAEMSAILDKPADQHQADQALWSYCPECGCEEMHHENGEHKQCENCHQEWFSDIDYSEVVRGNLQKLKAEQPAPVAVVMPERKGANHKDWREWTHEEIGYNKALAEVARLNGVKP